MTIYDDHRCTSLQNASLLLRVTAGRSCSYPINPKVQCNSNSGVVLYAGTVGAIAPSVFGFATPVLLLLRIRNLLAL